MIFRPTLLAALVAAAPALALQPLETFVAAAHKFSPDAREAQANLGVQSAQADVSLGRVLPGVNARGTITRNQREAAVSLGPGQPTIVIVPLTQYDVVATLTVPLIDAAGFERVAAARSTERSAQSQYQTALFDIEAAVAQDYYQLVANLALVAASQKALEVSRESLRLATDRFQAGAAPSLDVDRARADVETQNQQLAAANLQVALASRALESVSGVAAEPAPATLVDDLHAEPALQTFETAVDKLPAVIAANEAARAADQQAQAQQYAYLPVLSGNFVERGTSAPGFIGNYFTWQAILALNWDLDFTIPASARAQSAAAEAAHAREQRARILARDAIQRQWETVSAQIVRSRSARVGFEAATHAADSARDRYQAGAINQLELLQAQRDAFAADVARIQADAELVNARAHLRLATGISLLDKSK